MKHSTRSTGIAAALAFLSTAGIAATAPDDTAFRLMSEQEISDHAAAMATLEGAAREEYRNTQYRALRARAMEQGYAMPESPPWVDAAAAQQDPMAQHQAMRERLQAHREQAAADMPPVQAPVEARPAAITAAPTDTAETAAPSRTAAQSQAPAAAAASVQTEAPAAVDPPAAQQAGVPAVPSAPAPAEPAPETAPITSTAPIAAPPAETESTAPAAAGMQAQERMTGAPAGVGSEAMSAYRETMRARFDEYMRERQAQFEENIRRHREQREVTLDQPPGRAIPPTPPSPPRMQPYGGYPPAPAYGPRYPSGFPGYRTPYWQQNP